MSAPTEKPALSPKPRPPAEASHDGAANVPGSGPREERFRLASLAAGVPLVLLIAPMVVPLGTQRSLLVEAGREPFAFLIVCGLVTWTFLTGFLSVAYGLRRKVPRTAAFAMPAAMYLLESLGVALIALYVLTKASPGQDTPILVVAAATSTLSVYLLLRGFLRAGWERWAQLVGGAWVGHGALSVLLLFNSTSPFEDQVAGAWVLLFAVSALTPIMAWALYPRRGEKPLRRSAAPRAGATTGR